MNGIRRWYNFHSIARQHAPDKSYFLLFVTSSLKNMQTDHINSSTISATIRQAPRDGDASHLRLFTPCPYSRNLFYQFIIVNNFLSSILVRSSSQLNHSQSYSYNSTNCYLINQQSVRRAGHTKNQQDISVFLETLAWRASQKTTYVLFQHQIFKLFSCTNWERSPRCRYGLHPELLRRRPTNTPRQLQQAPLRSFTCFPQQNKLCVDSRTSRPENLSSIS